MIACNPDQNSEIQFIELPCQFRTWYYMGTLFNSEYVLGGRGKIQGVNQQTNSNLLVIAVKHRQNSLLLP